MAMPAIQSLSPRVAVAAQLDAAAMPDLAAAGFKSVINNRPDFEGGPTQPTAAELGEAARAAGLAYAHLPVSPAIQTPQEIAAFARLVAELPGPVLAFCRSGTRSGKLYQAAFGA